jgi:hypothetical protein
MAVPEIGSGEDLERWLEDKPADWAQAITARVALRMLPLAFQLIDLDNNNRKNINPHAIVLETFRAIFISWACRKYESYEMNTAVRAAARAADVAAYGAYVLDLAGDAVRAVARAADAAHIVYVAHVAADVARLAADAAHAAADFKAADGIWSAIATDCEWLEGNGEDGRLIDQPLWLLDVQDHERYRANLPIWARRPLDSFAVSGMVKATSWYLGEAADIALATQPDEFWTVTEERTPDRIMDAVARVVGWRIAKGTERPSTTVADFIVQFLERHDGPATIDQIRRGFADADYLVVDKTMRGELSRLAISGEILRIEKAVYAATKSRAGENYVSIPADIPVPPLQGHGPHLGVRDGQIVFAAVSNTAQPGTDHARVERLLPIVREALDALIAATPQPGERGNDAFARERRMAARYLDASSGNVESIDFDLLFGIGTSLMNRLAADAKRSIESDLAPLSDAQKLALEDFQGTHGPMIVATAAGADAVADAEKVIRNPEEERRLRDDIADFMKALQAERGLAKPEVTEFLHDVATEMATGHQPERSLRFGQGAARNTAIVVTSVGTMAALPPLGFALGGFIGSVLTTMLSCVLWEITKKTKSFESVTKPAIGFVDGLSEQDLAKLDDLIERGTSERFARFALKEEARLRAIAGDRPEFQWLHKQLDFIKASHGRKK